MSEEKPEKAKRSKRIYVYWGVALALLVAAGLFSWLVVVPVLKVREPIQRCHLRSSSTYLPPFMDQEIERLGGPHNVRPGLAIYVRLPSRWFPHRDIATQMLGRCGESAIPHLISLLADDAGGVRYRAAEALGSTDDARKVVPLIAALGDSTHIVRLAAACALQGVRDPRVVEPLSMALQDQEADVRAAASVALGKTGSDQAVRPLIGALSDKQEEVRRSAAEALGMLRDAKSATPLLKLLGDEDYVTQLAAMGALASIGAPAIPALRGALQDGGIEVRRGAAVALRTMRLPEAAPVLAIALRDSYYPVRDVAAEGLVELGKPAAEPVIALLQDKAALTRRTAAHVLGKIKALSAVDPLIRSLGDLDGDVRAFSAEALGRIGDAKALRPLIDALDDQDWTVRLEATRALGRLGEEEAAQHVSKMLAAVDLGRPDLRELRGALLRDRSPLVRAATAHAVFVVRGLDGPGLDILIALLADESSEARLYSAHYLGVIGPRAKRALPNLEKLLENEADEKVRKATAEALKKIRKEAPHEK